MAAIDIHCFFSNKQQMKISRKLVTTSLVTKNFIDGNFFLSFYELICWKLAPKSQESGICLLWELIPLTHV